MRSIAATGLGGFLGWHLRVHARAHLGTSIASVPLGPAAPQHRVAEACGAEHVVHLAGINRGSDTELRDGNIGLARQLASGLRSAPRPPTTLVFANSTQAGNGTAYGDGKEAASDILRECAREIGADFTDLRLPNIFGEHGRPYYNSVIATFAHLVASGGEPIVHEDKVLDLVHAQDVAQALLSSETATALPAKVEQAKVSEVRNQLIEFGRAYSGGEIPHLERDIDVALFNTLRSHIEESHWPQRLARKADARGAFFESVRSHGAAGQTSFSTTVPGAVRGNHYHLHKIERFVVLAGSGTISLRRLFDSRVVQFEVSGEEPVAIDMPTMWAHNISNTGPDQLYTLFWTNELFSSEAPDTYWETV